MADELHKGKRRQAEGGSHQNWLSLPSPHSDRNWVVDALIETPCRRKQQDKEVPPPLIVDVEFLNWSEGADVVVAAVVLVVGKLLWWRVGDCRRFGRLLGARVFGVSVALPI